MLLEIWVRFRLLDGAHIVGGSKVEFLGNPAEASLRLILTVGRQVDSRNESHPDFGVTYRLDQSDISVVRPRILDLDPLVVPEFRVFRFVVLENYRHFLCRHQNVFVQYKMKALASLPHVNFLECLYIDVALRRVRARSSKYAQWLPYVLVMNTLIDQSNHGGPLMILLDPHLPHFGVFDTWQEALSRDVVPVLLVHVHVVFLRVILFVIVLAYVVYVTLEALLSLGPGPILVGQFV